MLRRSRDSRRRRIGVAVLSALVGAACSGCFDPDYGEGGFACRQTAECPDGYVCLAVGDGFECQIEKPPEISASVDPKDLRIGGAKGVQLTVTVKNFFLDEAHFGAKETARGRGHYHVYVDTEASGYILASAHRHEQLKLKLSEATQKRIKPGPHKLLILLANNNHTIYSPRTSTTVDINVLRP